MSDNEFKLTNADDDNTQTFTARLPDVLVGSILTFARKNGLSFNDALIAFVRAAVDVLDPTPVDALDQTPAKCECSTAVTVSDECEPAQKKTDKRFENERSAEVLAKQLVLAAVHAVCLGELKSDNVTFEKIYKTLHVMRAHGQSPALAEWLLPLWRDLSELSRERLNRSFTAHVLTMCEPIRSCDVMRFAARGEPEFKVRPHVKVPASQNFSRVRYSFAKHYNYRR